MLNAQFERLLYLNLFSEMTAGSLQISNGFPITFGTVVASGRISRTLAETSLIVQSEAFSDTNWAVGKPDEIEKLSLAASVSCVSDARVQ